MVWSAKWSELPEFEVLPNNFRRAAAGLQSSYSKIRLVHPSETPLHSHESEEQAVFMLTGAMDVTIATQTLRLSADEVCVIPAGTPHRFKSIAGEAVFIEIFAPGRIQNLVGFLGKVF